MPMKGRCIMMCAGEFHPMKIEREPGDWVLAVDGGLKYLEELGVELNTSGLWKNTELWEKITSGSFLLPRTIQILWQQRGWESAEDTGNS